MVDESSRPVTITTLRELWPYLIDEERAEAFSLVSRTVAHEFFASLSAPDKARLLESLPPREAQIWIRVLAPDEVTDVLQAATPEHREVLLGMLDDPTRREIHALLAYAEDEAGGLMNPRFASLRPDTTVDVAIRYLRRRTRDQAETIYYIYVLDAEQHLIGVMSLRQLFRAPAEALIRDIMVRECVTVREDTDQEAVARLIASHHLLAVPVVDEQNRMQGIITVDDVVNVVQREATEDIQKIGGSEALGAPYLQIRFFTMVKKRAGWLAALFLGEMLTATAMGYFEGEIAKAVILAIFIPLIISSGGNSGSQASTLVVRALALQELRPWDWFRVLYREIGSGLALGMTLGSIGFLRIILWQMTGLYQYGPHYIRIALTVWISLVGVVTFGTTAGSMLPFLLRRLGFDPATSSAPFVATLVDVSGLVIYFLTAALVLKGTIL